MEQPKTGGENKGEKPKITETDNRLENIQSLRDKLEEIRNSTASHGEKIEKLKEITEERKKLRENVDEEVYQAFLKEVSEGKNYLKIPSHIEERLSSPEVQQAALKGILNSVSDGYVWIAEDIQKKITIDATDLAETIEKGFANYLRHQQEFNDFGNLDESRSYMLDAKKVFDVIKTIKIPEKKLEDIVFSEVLYRMKIGQVSDVSNLLKKFNISKEKLTSPQIQPDLKTFAKAIFSHNKIFYLEEIEKHLPGIKEAIHTPEVLEAGFNLMISSLERPYVYDFERIIKELPELQKTFNEKSVKESALNGFVRGFSVKGSASMSDSAHRFIDDAQKIIKSLSLTQEELSDPRVLSVAKNTALECLKIGWFDNYKKIRRVFPIPEAEFNSTEFSTAANNTLKSKILSPHEDEEELKKILEDFPGARNIIESDEVKDELADNIVRYLDDRVEMKEILLLKSRMMEPIPSESKQKIDKAVKTRFLQCLRTGDIDMALTLQASFDIPKEEFQTKEAQILINKNIVLAMGGSDFVTALELSKMAGISEEEMEKTVKESILKLISDGKVFRIGSETGYRDHDEENDDDGHNYYGGRYEDEKKKKKRSGSVEELLAVSPEFGKIMEDPQVHREMQDLFVYCAKTGQIEPFNTMKQKFKIDQETIQLAFQQTTDGSSANKFKALLALNELSEKPIDPLLMKSSDIFGDFVSFENYQTIKEIADGNISEECRMFGVKVGGSTGINQLEQGFVKFRADILTPDFDPEILNKSKLARDYFKSFIRYDESEWGGQSGMENTIERYLECRDNGEYDAFPLNKEFKESDVLMIDTVDKEAKPVQYSEAFLNRFKTIHGDLNLAKELYLSRFPITKVISGLNQHLVRVVQELSIKRDSMEGGKGKEVLSEKITKLQNLDLRGLKNFEENFQLLSKLNDKEIDSTLRQAMFMMGYAKNRNQLEKDLTEMSTDNPKLDDITWTMNFSDHIVNKEVMSQYFKDKNARNEFRKLISTKSFEEELTRFRNQDKKGKLPVKFIPSKGILLEFSGHIADACWADKYTHTIPATFPNFTAVTMVQNPGTKHERLFGSSIIIDTREAVKDGQGLLLIRGLNPIENTINQMSVEDFYKQFVDYIKSLGEKTGKKVAIVIDGHSGGAATNRPLLFNYLQSLKLEKIKVPYRETEFNGYDVTKHAYLVN